MAVVFISPKKRQRVLFTIIGVMFLIIIVIVYFLVFLVKPVNVGSIPVVNLSKANIDLSIFDSKQFQQLQPFIKLNIQGGQTGRDNPFVPYYQVTPTPTPTATPTPTPAVLIPIKSTK